MGDSEMIAGLGTRATWVRGSPDLMQRVSTNEEKALASSIGSGAQLRDVLVRCGLPEAKAIATLLGMRLRGLVQPMAPPPGGVAPGGAAAPRGPLPPLRPSRPSGPSGGPSGFPPAPRPAPKPIRVAKAVDNAALDEAAVDLDEARKKEVLAFEARLDSDDYFSLLGLPMGAPAADCKKAYYELTKKFHPDRYFGKSLGSFRARIEAVFRKLTEAQAVLSDPPKRAEYLNEHPELSAKPLDLGEPAVDPQLAAERAAERQKRLAKHPYLAKQGKVHDLVAQARADLGRDDFARAIAALTLATQMDPKHHEAAELLSRAKKSNDKVRAASEFKAATEAETMGQPEAALSHYRSAVSTDPDNLEYVFRAGKALFARGGESELKEAHALLRKATELAPTKVEYHLAFAKLLLRIGLEKNAQREYEVVLKLDPDNATAKEQVRKLKWKF